MLKDQIKTLVEQVVREFIAQKTLKTQKTNKAQKESATKLFILLVGRSQLQPRISELVAELVLQNSQVTLATCSLWEEIGDRLHPHQHIKLEALDEQGQFALLNQALEADVWLLPNLTLSLLAKLALTIDDTLPAWLLIQAQLKGKTIITATDNIASGVDELLWTPASLKNKQLSYLRQLQRDQMKVTVIRKIPDVVKEVLANSQHKRPILLAKHIELLAEQKHALVELPENVIITPIARELAKDFKIELTRTPRKGEFNDHS